MKKLLIGAVGTLLGVCHLVAVVSTLSSKTPDTNMAAVPVATGETGGDQSASKPTATAASKAPSAVCTVGQRCELGGIALTVNEVSTVGAISECLTLEDGHGYLALNVTIENVSQHEAPYNPPYFRVHAGDGTEYSTSMVAPSPDPKWGEMQTGDKVQGNVAFEVPLDAEGVIALYEPLVLLGSYKETRVDLGR